MGQAYSRGHGRGQGCVLAVAFISVLAAAAAEEPTFQFMLWGRADSPIAQSAMKDARVVEVIEEAPCGVPVEVRITKMSSFEDAPFAPSEAVELSDSGEVISKWFIPVDAVPWALGGNNLLVNYQGELYWISTEGSIRRERMMDPTRSQWAAECPKQLTSTEYGSCGGFRDLRDGRVRMIAAPDVCT